LLTLPSTTLESENMHLLVFIKLPILLKFHCFHDFKLHNYSLFFSVKLHFIFIQARTVVIFHSLSVGNEFEIKSDFDPKIMLSLSSAVDSESASTYFQLCPLLQQ
jgi:hypothetical protein